MAEETVDLTKLTPAEKEQIKQLHRIANIAAKLADYSLNKLVQFMSEAAGAPLTPNDALQFLEEHPELLSFELLDEAIGKDFKVRALVNTSLRLVGVILSRNDGWAAELRQKGPELLLQMLQYRPDLYNLLKNKPNLLTFLSAYILYKMGV